MKSSTFNTNLFIFLLILLLLLIYLLSKTEHFNLTAAFIDLATY